MGQFSVEKPGLPGSVLSGNQHTLFCFSSVPTWVRLIREKATRRFLSPQVDKQIQIGLDVSQMARQEVADGEKSQKAFVTLISQCLKRDPNWKAYYAEQMEGVIPRGPNESVLKLYAAEFAAEVAYVAGDYVGASDRLQQLIDDGHVEKDNRGWYLQERARYFYRTERSESQKLQVAAHKKNRMLLKPPTGVTVTKLTVVSQVERSELRPGCGNLQPMPKWT